MEAALDFVTRWEAWVYPALAVYVAIKSGLLPIFAAALASAGALDIGLVLLALFGGTVLGEEAKFRIGRWLVPRMASRPRFVPVLARLREMAAKWGPAWTLLYRWPKGGRTLGAVPLGAAGWPWLRFALFNLAGAAIWSVSMAGIGWIGGATILGAIEQWGGAVTFVLLLLMVVLLVIGWRASRARRATS